ncbi:MAG: PAS domain-containing protein, partial [Halobacteriota archaeon]
MTEEDDDRSRVLYLTGEDGGGGDPVRRELERTGEFDVVTATRPSARQALADGLDCVVSRQRLGVTTGVTCLEEIRALDADIPFVLVTEDGDERLASRAVAAGVTEYVPLADVDEGRFLERVHASLEPPPSSRGVDSRAHSVVERRLREELQLKERAMDEAPVGITISDATQYDNPLIYVNDAFERLTDYPKAFTLGRNCRFLQGEETNPKAVDEMRAAVDDEVPVSTELVNYRESGDPFWNRVDIAPLRDDDGEVTHFVGFQTDVTARKEAELQVQHEREALEHLLSRINGLVQDVTQGLVSARSREEIEQLVCDRITDVDTYRCCWVAERDLGRETVVPRAYAGMDEPAVVSVSSSADGVESGSSPTVDAIRTQEPQVLQERAALSSLARSHGWVDARDVRAVASLPLVYQNTTYGVLTVCATEREAFEERELVVMQALVRMTATAINALERGRILVAEDVLELELQIRDEGLFLVGLSERL